MAMLVAPCRVDGSDSANEATAASVYDVFTSFLPLRILDHLSRHSIDATIIADGRHNHPNRQWVGILRLIFPIEDSLRKLPPKLVLHRSMANLCGEGL